MQTQPQSPFFDDYDQTKGFHQILFRPGYAVQARELTQSQSILQKQIERFGLHVFENGSPVLGGQTTFDQGVRAIRVLANYASVPVVLDSFQNTKVRGATSEVEAPVVHTEIISGQTYIFVSLKGSETFLDGEDLEVYDIEGEVWNVAATLNASGATTPAAIFSLADGVFFHDGYFVWVPAQTLVVSTTTSSPSNKIGLTVATSIIDEVMDTSLLDPALGSPNENAPGAHRLKIVMTLSAIAVDATPGANFIELFRVSEGDVQKNLTTPVYSELEKTLARRTYDESGNYTVRPFKISIKNQSEINDWESEQVPDASARSVVSVYLDYATKKMFFSVFDTEAASTSRARGYVKVIGNTLSAAAVVDNFSGTGTLAANGSDIDFNAISYPTGQNAVRWAGNGAVFDITAGANDKIFSLTFTDDFSDDTRFEFYFTNPETSVENIFFGTKQVTGVVSDKNFYEGSIDAKKATNFKIEIDPGKAYIFGQEFETISKETLLLPKSRATKQVQNYAIGLDYGSYALIDNLSGYFAVEALQTVYLCSGTALDGTTLPGTQIGTAKVREIVKDGSAYRIYLFDFAFTGANSFENVRSIFADDTYGATIGQARIATSGIVGGKAQLFETSTSTLLFPIAQPVIKTVRPNGVLDASYTTRVKFDATFSGGSLAISSGVDRQFLAGAENYLIIRNSSGEVITPDAVTLNGGANTATITKAGAAYAVTILAPVFLQQAPLATKTLVENVTFNIVNGTATYYNSSRRFYSLRKSDIFRVVSVVDALNQNITSSFELDDGQRDNFYDHGGLILKQGIAIANDQYPLEVTFDYFTHTGPGFFAVDSYGDIDYGDIPHYQSPTTGQIYALRDVIDFRPRREDDAVSTRNLEAYSGGNLIPANTGSNVMISDYEFYLPRRDKLILNRNRQFELIQGVPALNPVSPLDDQNGMTLYNLYIPAYSFQTRSVIQQFVENKRYTMRDIGSLERRIENLEYYTSLTLLEKATLDTDIRDASGLSRFKNGMLVDSFSGHGIGDIGSIDYKCSIDFLKNYLRAPFISRNYKLSYDAAASSGLTLSGNDTVGYALTLPFTSTVMVQQPLASKVVNLNPYLVIKNVGHIEMNPSSDDWVDTQTRPEVTINTQGDRDAWEFILNSVNGVDGNGFGTQWNDWETIWTGETVISETNTGVEDTWLTFTDVFDFNGTILTTNGGFRGVQRNLESFAFIATGPDGGRTIGSAGGTTQTRTGVRNVISPETVTERIGDVVTDVTIRPFMRQTDIAWSVNGLRPNRRLYLFFDGVAIDNRDSDYVTPVTVTTDGSGAASGFIRIPAGVFRTGEREFTVIDDPANDREAATTYASQKFHASGLNLVRQDIVVSTRVPVVTQETVTETRTIPPVVIQPTPIPQFRIDPVAQTFFVNEDVLPNGAFLSSIGVYFKTKSRTGVPVRLEIRPTQNGYPDSNRIVPLSVVFKHPDDVNVSETGAAVTNFSFPIPLYLPPGEYAVVLLADSQEYEVFVSEIGKLDLISGGRISTQPYLGSLFKSQNASTWTPIQEEDLKMVINRCVFSGTGTAMLRNTATDTYNYNVSKFLSENIQFGQAAPLVWQQEGRTPANAVIDFETVLANKNMEWDSARRISGAGQIRFRGTLSTNDPAISPLIDLNRQSVFLIQNVIGTSTVNETTAKSGEALAKYVTRRVNLEEGFNADSMRIWFDAVRPQGTDIQVYVKVLAAEDSDLFDDRGYILITDTQNTNLFSSSDEDYKEFIYDIPAGALEYVNSAGNEFTTFNSFAVKLVMLSNNTSRVPRIKNLRGISLE